MREIKENSEDITLEEFEKRKQELLEEARNLDLQANAFERWKFWHPIQYRKWLKTYKGKAYKRQQGLMCKL